MTEGKKPIMNEYKIPDAGLERLRKRMELQRTRYAVSAQEQQRIYTELGLASLHKEMAEKPAPRDYAHVSNAKITAAAARHQCNAYNRIRRILG